MAKGLFVYGHVASALNYVWYISCDHKYAWINDLINYAISLYGVPIYACHKISFSNIL